MDSLEERLLAAGMSLPRSRESQPSFGDLRREVTGKTLEDLYFDIRNETCNVSIDKDEKCRSVQSVQVSVNYPIGGEPHTLVVQDRFDLVTGDQYGLMHPLRHKLRKHQDWRSAMEAALSEKVGLDPLWQKANIRVEEDSYHLREVVGADPDYPGMTIRQTLHDVRVHIDDSDESVRVDTEFRRIGLPSGDTFVTREVRSQGHQRLHIWSWKNCQQERSEMSIQLGKELASHGVDVSLFGTDNMKSLQQFYVEVHELKQSSLAVVDASSGPNKTEMLRRCKLLEINVHVVVRRRQYKLVSKEQYLDDGRRRKITQHVMFKMNEEQTWQEALPLALTQRLGLRVAVQEECLKLEGTPVFREEVRWSAGYPLRSSYKIWSVQIAIANPNHHALQELGLPRCTSFVTKEGVIGKKGDVGRLHVWNWVPLEEQPDGEKQKTRFGGTAYEKLNHQIHEVDHLVQQVHRHAQETSSELEVPLGQILEQMHDCTDMVSNIDASIWDVDIAEMLYDDSGHRSSGIGVITEFISSNFTRQGPIAAPDNYVDEEMRVSRITTGISVVPFEAARQVVQDGHTTWELNVFEMMEGDECPVRVYGEQVLQPLCSSTLRCSLRVVQSFLDRAAALYYNNPYHNKFHATQVCHGALWNARNFGLAERQPGRERAGFIVAAICHDLKHFGRNAAFCVQTHHPLALLYNDRAVLENMHAATAFAIFANDGADPFANISGVDKLFVRENIIELILSTDMREHFPFISKYRVRRDAPDFSLDEESDRLLLAKTCIKAADICHSALPWEMHYAWSCRCVEEFFEQGDEERRLGVPTSPLCDRNATAENLVKSQSGFIQIVCLPLFDALACTSGHCSDGPGIVEASEEREAESAEEKLSSYLKANSARWLQDDVLASVSQRAWRGGREQVSETPGNKK